MHKIEMRSQYVGIVEHLALFYEQDSNNKTSLKTQ